MGRFRPTPLPRTSIMEDVQPPTQEKLHDLRAARHADADLGIVPRTEATERARSEADRQGAPVYIRDPVTDRAIRVIRPRG